MSLSLPSNRFLFLAQRKWKNEPKRKVYTKSKQNALNSYFVPMNFVENLSCSYGAICYTDQSTKKKTHQSTNVVENITLSSSHVQQSITSNK